MQATRANLINALVLLIIGIWGAWQSTSWTSNIPIGFGLILLLLHPMLKKQNKAIGNVTFVLTLGFVLSLIMPAIRMYSEAHYVGVIRICLMIVSGLIAAWVLFQSLGNSEQIKNK